MKATGIVRRMDSLGRIVIPKMLRRRFELSDDTGLEITVDGDRIILSKYRPVCIFCGGTASVSEYRDKHICLSCSASLGQQPRNG
ncbi:MAG: AbrB/MazE/SpoVT family DNA-binding domain-containing protein [Negativicutes bacterium]|nr:AbrB/MazE/SpoVT family DNA-binding domain-containing protein [Negativicutes bacterium]